MSQPPSNLPPGLSFARRTTAPVKLPRLEFTRLGGPAESPPVRTAEPETPPAQQPFPTATPQATPVQQAFPAATPQATPAQIQSFPAVFAQATPPSPPQAIPTTLPPAAPPVGQQAPIQLGETTPQLARLLTTPPTTPAKEDPIRMMTTSGSNMAIPDARDSAKVIVYGRSGSTACMRAIQDLMERQVSFQYVDVSRDADAAAHLAAICNGDPVVPVIIHIGFNS